MTQQRIFSWQLLLAVLGVIQGLAQPSYTYRNYTEANGLPSSEVYQVYQDRSGFIWMATDNGVVRFDGSDFMTLKKSDGLPDQVVFGFYEDDAGRLWFRSFTGATAVFWKNKVVPYRYNELVKAQVGDEIINALAIDSLGRLCFSNSKFSYIDSAGNVQSMPTTEDVLSLERVAKDAFLLNYNPFNRRENARSSVSIFGRNFEVNLVKHYRNNAVPCYRFWKGNLLLSVGHNLLRYDGTQLTSAYISDRAIISLSVDSQEQLWVGTLGGGVFRFSESLNETPYQMPLLKGKSVTSVLQDREQGYWISTLEKGVFYLPNLEMKNYTFSNDSKVTGVTGDDKSFYAINYSGSLTAIDFNSKKNRWSNNYENPFMSIMVAGKGEGPIWASTTASTYLLSKQGKLLRELPQIKSLKAFSEDSLGNVWGANRNGIYKFDASGILRKTLTIDFWARSILVEGNRVWIAGVSGLSVADSSLTNFRPIPEFKDYKVSQMLRLGSGRIVVATVGNGFYVVNNGEVQPNRYNPLIRASNVYTMVHADSTLWLGTENGLVKIPEKTLMNGPTQLTCWDRFSGLTGDKVNYLASNDREIVVFFDGGYTVVPKNLIQHATHDPQFYLKSRLVNNTLVEDKGMLELSHTQNNIVFSFGFIGYSSRYTEVRHRLQEDQPWNTTLGYSIAYYSLPPGHYGLQIQYSVDGLTWKAAEFPNRFSIAPPWWETLYFRVFSFAIFGVVIYGGVLFRLRAISRVKRKEHELQDRLREQRENIAKDLHDNIGNQLTSLSLGLHHLEKDRDLNLISPLQEEVHATMTELRDTIWAMHQPQISLDQLGDKLKNLVWRLGHRNGASINCTCDISERLGSLLLQPAQAINIFRILQEAVSNSLKHAHSDTVSISVEEQGPGFILFTVKDNGIGFDLSSPLAPDHYGLVNMGKRAEEINAKFSIRSENGKGTWVLLGVQV